MLFSRTRWRPKVQGGRGRLDEGENEGKCVCGVKEGNLPESTRFSTVKPSLHTFRWVSVTIACIP